MAISRQASNAQLRAAKKKVRTLLERLAARHLTDDEVTEATFGMRTDLEIQWDYKAKTLSTTGTDHHYVARLETDNALA